MREYFGTFFFLFFGGGATFITIITSDDQPDKKIRRQKINLLKNISAIENGKTRDHLLQRFPTLRDAASLVATKFFPEFFFTAS